MNFQLPGGNTSGLFSPGGNGLELASTQQQPLSPLPHPSQPAMMLFQQNSRLTNGIDSTRKEYKKCLEDIEDTKENTKQILQVDRKTIEEQIKAAIQEREDLLEELEMTLMEQLVTMQEEESEAKTSRDQAQDRFQTAEDTIVDRRKAFMQACGEYRHRIQVLSYQGEALDIKNFLAPLLACAVLQSHTEDNVPDQETNKEWSSNLDKVVAGLSEVIGIRDCDKKNDEEDDDEELKEALQALKKQKLSMKMTHDVLQKLLAKKETTTQNHEKREVQKKNLLSQRQRLEEDVKSLRVQIQDTQQQTEETQAMIAVFKNDDQKNCEDNQQASCHANNGHYHQDSVTAASRPIFNPYSRSRETPKDKETDGNASAKMSYGRTITPQSNSRDRKKSQSSKTPRGNKGHKGSTPQVASTETQRAPSSIQQFPHRAGRIRHSKFGASLRVSNKSVSDSMADVVLGKPPPKDRSRILQDSSSSEEGDDLWDHSRRRLSTKRKQSHGSISNDQAPRVARAREH